MNDVEIEGTGPANPKIGELLACAAATLLAAWSLSAGAQPDSPGGAMTFLLLGDSRGVGVLADTTRGEFLAPPQKLLMEAIGIALRRAQAQVDPEGADNGLDPNVALKYRDWFRNDHLHYLVGTWDGALASRIARESGRVARVVNTSIGAGTVQSLALQEGIARQELVGGGLSTVDGIVVDIGAVDFVVRTPPSEFRGELRSHIARISQSANRAKFVVVGMPPVLDIVRRAKVEPNLVASRFLLGSETCASAHKRLGVANYVHDDLEADPASIEGRIEEYNQALKELASDLESGLLTGTRREVVFVPHVELDAQVGGLAADCWHPNAKANRLMAERLYGPLKELFR